MLEENGFTVERKLNLGGTPVAQAAIESGEIDLYPEYTGTGLLTVLKLPASSDQQQVYNTVKAGYQEQFGLVWLDPAPMNNTQALAMTEERANELNIRTISDFAAQANDLVLIGPPEFEVRRWSARFANKPTATLSCKSIKPWMLACATKGCLMVKPM
jgi:osmoprotectant transport system substrate-binding protein